MPGNIMLVTPRVRLIFIGIFHNDLIETHFQRVFKVKSEVA